MGLLSGVFLTPMGLLGLASLVPLIVLYLLRPDPRKFEIPTYEFLMDETSGGGRSTAFRRLRRNLLFVLQVLVLVLVTLAIASPYVMSTQGAAEGATVIVVDASASMTTDTGGGTRFSRAIAAARDEVSNPTSVIVTGATTRVELERGSPEEARQTLGTLAPSDAPGDLREAVERASAIADEDDRIVVVSDFADDTDWEGAIASARARGQRVVQRQFDGGGRDNVGIVDLQLTTTTATVTVKNTGTTSARRTIRFGGETRQVSLEPGDVTSRTLPVPAGGGRIELTPGDSFSTDDTAVIVAPEDATIDVLLLTNDGNRFLETALSVLPGVELTVKHPPAAVSAEFDVIVFSNVKPNEVLDGTVETARETVASGGGVAIQAQPDMRAVGYGDLLLVEPRGVVNTTSVSVVSDSRLVADTTFPTPDRHVRASLKTGRPLVNTSDGSPLIALAQSGEGRILYYGYLEDESDFKFQARYPVFWKHAVTTLSGRERLETINRRTGERAEFGAGTVNSPSGAREGPTVLLDRAGVYEGERRVGANLLSVAESNVTAPPVQSLAGGAEGTQQRPFELTPFVALAALGGVLAEIGYLHYRGDL